MRPPLRAQRIVSRCAAFVGLAVVVAFAAIASPFAIAGQPAVAAALREIGRVATPAEVKAWDIDVRGDFKGLPRGAGSVSQGADLWDGKCASCHGAFGESNQVFTPIVGGTSKQDIASGRVYFLSHPGYPHRTTLMKVSKLSSLWDYIHRAMPWNAPKSLTDDEVYAVLAYILNLGEIVPADFTLSDRNIAEVQQRLPNRGGKVVYENMWLARGHGDVKNPLCMSDCPVQGPLASSLPDAARNSNGNIGDQVRPFGPARGTDTSVPPRTEKVGTIAAAAEPVSAATLPIAAAASAAVAPPPVATLLQANHCTACHGIDNRIVGPAFREVANKYAGRNEVLAYLAGKIRAGGQGAWGVIPMPAQAQISDADATAIARWLATGAK